VQISTELSTYGRGVLDSKVQNKLNTEKSGLVRSNELNKAIASSEATGLSSSESLISKSERNFFKKMFPESAPVIDNYVLFNSSGRLTSPEINKGAYVDAWV